MCCVLVRHISDIFRIAREITERKNLKLSVATSFWDLQFLRTFARSLAMKAMCPADRYSMTAIA